MYPLVLKSIATYVQNAVLRHYATAQDDKTADAMQSSLFDANNDPNYKLLHKLKGGAIDEYPTAFSQEESAKFMGLLLDLVPWQQDHIIIAGKRIAVPRLQCWMGDSGSNYGYSGIRLSPTPWIKPVEQIRERIKSLSGCDFNSVLLNYYRSGQDSVAWHADDEAELGPDPVIASVSFGCERKFQLRPKANPCSRSDKHELLLRNGSILIMKNGIQNNWVHQVPKVKKPIDGRINLTFRTILS